jgi:hypothetical protein
MSWFKIYTQKHTYIYQAPLVSTPALVITCCYSTALHSQLACSLLVLPGFDQSQRVLGHLPLADREVEVRLALGITAPQDLYLATLDTGPVSRDIVKVGGAQREGIPLSYWTVLGICYYRWHLAVQFCLLLSHL